MHFLPTAIIPFLAFLFSALMLNFYRKSSLGVNDIPNERSMHKFPVKKGGGAIFIAIFILSILLDSGANALVAGLVFTLLIGIYDDLYNPGSLNKLFLEFLFFLPFSFFINQNIIILGFYIPYFLAIPTTAFYFVFIINLINFMDGMDLYLLLSTLAAIVVLSFLIPSIPSFIFLFIAILLSFAVFNYPPAKMFMGDSGSLPIGFMIAMMPFFAVETAIDLTDIFFLIPVFLIDGILTIMKRALTGENILKAHRLHLYQIISEKTLSKNNTVILFSLTNLFSIPFLIFDLKRAGILSLSIILSGIYLFIAKSRNSSP